MIYNRNLEPFEMCDFIQEEVEKITDTYGIDHEIYASYRSHNVVSYFIEVEGIELDKGFFMDSDPLKMLARFKEWAAGYDKTQQD